MKKIVSLLLVSNEIKLSNVRKTISGKTEITYSDEAEFKRDGSIGQVMIEILKHYFKRYRHDDHEYIEISEEMKDSYELEPAFIENREELDAIYVSAYDGNVEDDKLNSWRLASLYIYTALCTFIFPYTNMK